MLSKVFSLILPTRNLTLEKTSLEQIIGNLRDEKQQLGFLVEKTQKDLNDLKDELTETQIQAYTIKTASKTARREVERNQDKHAIYDTLEQAKA